MSGALPSSMHHLVNKADVTPSPLIQAATGAVWREKLTILLAFVFLLLPSRLQSSSLYPVETITTPYVSGAERNRTAVRNIG